MHHTRQIFLDCSKLKAVFGWKPRWHIDQAIEKTVEWTKAWENRENISEIMDQQIAEYCGLGGNEI